MQTTKIFLASSAELSEDREDLEIFIGRKNKAWVDHGTFLDLIVWEDFLDAMSQTRLQDEYNKAIRDCDIFVMLFFTKVGKYTEEEFATAFGQFKATNKPIIFTYFKDAEISIGSANESDLMSLWAFKAKLATLGHFVTVYKNSDELMFHFDQQLDKLAASGLIVLDSDRVAATGGAAQGSEARMPHLAFGGWTLRNAIDDVGENWSNSVLKFTSQEPSAEGLVLRGTFTWRSDNVLVGTEEVTGYYLAATRELILEGQSVSDPQALAVGSYAAIVSDDERALERGSWGSTAQMTEAGYPGHWEASR